ncbi:hypothetical protein FRC06_006784, partial [Ceratobasidium sp. 370]
MSLTTTMGVRIGPIVLATLFERYLERHNVIRDSKARNELLFDEAFIVVNFSNTRIPAPPRVHNVRVLIPLSCCDEAAPLLLQALGGPEAVGGSKWWQVRGVRGVARNGSPSNETGARPNGDGNSTKTNDPALRRQMGGGGAELRRARTGRTRSRPVSAYGVVGEGTSAVKRPSTTTGGGGGSGSSVQVTPNTTESATPHPQLSTSQPRPSASQPQLSTPQPQPEESGPSNPISEEPEEAGEAHYESEMDDMR